MSPAWCHEAGRSVAAGDACCRPAQPLCKIALHLFGLLALAAAPMSLLAQASDNEHPSDLPWEFQRYRVTVTLTSDTGLSDADVRAWQDETREALGAAFGTAVRLRVGPGSMKSGSAGDDVRIAVVERVDRGRAVVSAEIFDRLCVGASPARQIETEIRTGESLSAATCRLVRGGMAWRARVERPRGDATAFRVQGSRLIPSRLGLFAKGRAARLVWPGMPLDAPAVVARIAQRNGDGGEADLYCGADATEVFRGAAPGDYFLVALSGTGGTTRVGVTSQGKPLAGIDVVVAPLSGAGRAVVRGRTGGSGMVELVGSDERPVWLRLQVEGWIVWQRPVVVGADRLVEVDFPWGDDEWAKVERLAAIRSATVGLLAERKGVEGRVKRLDLSGKVDQANKVQAAFDAKAGKAVAAWQAEGNELGGLELLPESAVIWKEQQQVLQKRWKSLLE